MAGRLTLDQLIVVQIHCPQPSKHRLFGGVWLWEWPRAVRTYEQGGIVKPMRLLRLLQVALLATSVGCAVVSGKVDPSPGARAVVEAFLPPSATAFTPTPPTWRLGSALVPTETASAAMGATYERLPFIAADADKSLDGLPSWVQAVVSDTTVAPCQRDCAAELGKLVIASSSQGLEYAFERPAGLMLVAIMLPGVVTRESASLVRDDAVLSLRGFVLELGGLGYEVHVRSAYRSKLEQQHLVDRYQTAGTLSVELPGYSQHQGGLAVDLGFTLQPGRAAISDTELRNLAHKYGIVHPYHWDPPHYFVLDAVLPGLTGRMLAAGIDVDDIANVNLVQLGLARIYLQRMSRYPGH